jgi:hypothetical protein
LKAWSIYFWEIKKLVLVQSVSMFILSLLFKNTSNWEVKCFKKYRQNSKIYIVSFFLLLNIKIVKLREKIADFEKKHRFIILFLNLENFLKMQKKNQIFFWKQAIFKVKIGIVQNYFGFLEISPFAIKKLYFLHLDLTWISSCVFFWASNGLDWQIVLQRVLVGCCHLGDPTGEE